MRGSGRQRARPERPAPEGLARTAQRAAGLPLPGAAGTRGFRSYLQKAALLPEQWKSQHPPFGLTEIQKRRREGGRERAPSGVQNAFASLISCLLQIALKTEQELEHKGCAFLSWQRRTN